MYACVCVCVCAVSHEELLALYEHFKFISASKDADGVIDLEEWLQALELRDSAFSRRIFQAFDDDNNGTISFQEFVVGLSVFSPRSTLEEKLDLSFRIYDMDGDGSIDKSELYAILRASLLENYQLNISDEDIQRLVDRTFEDTDTDGDGVISYDEYRNLVMSNPDILSQFSLNSDLLLENKPGEGGAQS